MQLSYCRFGTRYQALVFAEKRDDGSLWNLKRRWCKMDQNGQSGFQAHSHHDQKEKGLPGRSPNQMAPVTWNFPAEVLSWLRCARWSWQEKVDLSGQSQAMSEWWRIHFQIFTWRFVNPWRHMETLLMFFFGFAIHQNWKLHMVSFGWGGLLPTSKPPVLRAQARDPQGFVFVVFVWGDWSDFHPTKIKIKILWWVLTV